MNTETVPQFSVGELNQAIGSLISRAFAPTFILHASVSKAQLKNGHIWITLTDGKASISAVIWSSVRKGLDFLPKEEDGVEILGKLNFWENRASLVVQVIKIKPTLSTVLRQFGIVRSLLIEEGLINESRRRSLPKFPKSIAILTSVPSSAFADMLRTAKERWPLTKLFLFPIPVQGDVSNKIQRVLSKVVGSSSDLGIEALILARGGGSREDLIVFDDESLCRALANFPVPVITGLGHEDDLTVADLVSDHRSATPTAAIVDLLPSREIEKTNLLRIKGRAKDYFKWMVKQKKQKTFERKNRLLNNSPFDLISNQRQLLLQKKKLIEALSPTSILKRGFFIITNEMNQSFKSVNEIKINDNLHIEFTDGSIESIVKSISKNGTKE